MLFRRGIIATHTLVALVANIRRCRGDELEDADEEVAEWDIAETHLQALPFPP